MFINLQEKRHPRGLHPEAGTGKKLTLISTSINPIINKVEILGVTGPLIIGGLFASRIWQSLMEKLYRFL